MAQVTIDLPYPPSVNHYWRHTVIAGRTVVYVSAQGKAYRNRVIKATQLLNIPHYECPVSVTLDIAFPDNRRRDSDNLAKVIFDSLQDARILKDDKLIWKFSTNRIGIAKGGFVKVTIRELTEQEIIEAQQQREPLE